MTITLEKALEKSILGWLKLNNIFGFAVNGGKIPIFDNKRRIQRMFISTSINGVPDILCCYKGKFYGLECKAPERIELVRDKNGMPLMKKNGDYRKKTIPEGEQNVLQAEDAGSQ